MKSYVPLQSNTEYSSSLYQPLRLNIFSDTEVQENQTLKFTKGDRQPILESHIKYAYEVLQLRSNAKACEFFNVTALKWARYAKGFREPESGLTYYQLFTKRARQDSVVRFSKLRELHRLKRQKEGMRKLFIRRMKDNQLTSRTKISRIKLGMIQSELIKEECACCGFKEKSISKDPAIGGRVPLILDHINEDYKDFRFENLQLLCLNCFYNLIGSPIKYYNNRDAYTY